VFDLVSPRITVPWGDTRFTSMTAAFDGLSDGLRATLVGIKAWHSDGSFAESKVGLESKVEAFRDPALHPVIICHPVTGAPAIYVNGDFTTQFAGWTIEESAPLLEYIYRFDTQPIFTCRIKWQAGMVAIWNNRLVQHYTTADYAGSYG
jgi:taurine dioxygenase